MTAIHRAHGSTMNPASAGQMRDETLNWSARLGLCARATIYLLIGALALLVALGHSTAETDQWGAFQQINRSDFGHVALWIVAVGLAAYSVWRFSEAIMGATGDGSKLGARLKSLFRGCVYGFFAVTAFQIALGRTTTSQAHRQEGLTADVMRHTGGRWAVGIVGFVVLAVGLTLVYEGVTRKFEKYLRLPASVATRRMVRILGTIGTAARGAVFAWAGVFVIQAAIDYEPSKAAGLDGALRSMRDTTAGPWLLGAAAVGLIAFGLYGLAEARWRVT